MFDDNIKIILLEEILAGGISVVSWKIGAIREIEFPREIVFWTTYAKINFHKKNFFFDTRENKFLHFLFTYLFMSTDNL